ncbi:MAG: isoamylase early set domain-containing protein [Chloroflexota bacterium]|nr:isoamylase early set domain-containing protein [Chloroflexota bacterium]
MIRKTSSPQPDHVRIIFELPACLWADRIFLVGDFNGWCESATPMRQDRDGIWRATLDLPVGGQHEFRYLIDGHWKTDSHADGFAGNRYGSENSVVNVETPVTMIAEQVRSQVWERPLLTPPVQRTHRLARPLVSERTRRVRTLEPLAA